jgi:hypothetical protein
MSGELYLSPAVVLKPGLNLVDGNTCCKDFLHRSNAGSVERE